MTNLVLVLDPAGEVIKSLTVDHSKKKAVKTKLKIGTSGTHTVRLIRISGTSMLQIGTSMKQPAGAKALSATVKQVSGTGVALVQTLALPGATLDALFKPKTFTGPMALVFRTPSGSEFDLVAGGFQTNLPDGSIQLTGVPLSELGAYETEIQGYAANNEKVKVTLTPTQPADGSSTVIVD